MASLKKYLYFQQTLDAHNDKQLVKAADLITADELIKSLFAAITDNFIHFFDSFRLTERIKVLFELSQKRVFRPKHFEEQTSL